jgi:hypothetical protein
MWAMELNSPASSRGLQCCENGCLCGTSILAVFCTSKASRVLQPGFQAPETSFKRRTERKTKGFRVALVGAVSGASGFSLGVSQGELLMLESGFAELELLCL